MCLLFNSRPIAFTSIRYSIFLFDLISRSQYVLSISYYLVIFVYLSKPNTSYNMSVMIVRVSDSLTSRSFAFASTFLNLGTDDVNRFITAAGILLIIPPLLK